MVKPVRVNYDENQETCTDVLREQVKCDAGAELGVRNLLASVLVDKSSLAVFSCIISDILPLIMAYVSTTSRS